MAKERRLVEPEASPIGRTFVLGLPNAQGEFVMVLGESRWRVVATEGIGPGERVAVVAYEGDWLKVERVKTAIAS
ncbi:MAG: hypothetical protein Q8J78_06690 [Moraxellaceae bacterium]|nr:hypothetical protein [Moraxellaceae bacterium]